MNDEIKYLSREDHQRMEDELTFLTTVRRSEVAERLRLAMEEGGDQIENAELEDARNEKAFVEGEIQRLESILSLARIIEDDPTLNNGPDGVVRLNSTVTVREQGFDAETYHIVDPAVSDPGKGRISHVSPLGKAMMGKKAGDKVRVDTPDGVLEAEIISVK